MTTTKKPYFIRQRNAGSGWHLLCFLWTHKWNYGPGVTRSSLQVPPVLRWCERCNENQKWDVNKKRWNSNKSALNR